MVAQLCEHTRKQSFPLNEWTVTVGKYLKKTVKKIKHLRKLSRKKKVYYVHFYGIRNIKLNNTDEIVSLNSSGGTYIKYKFWWNKRPREKIKWGVVEVKVITMIKLKSRWQGETSYDAEWQKVKGEFQAVGLNVTSNSLWQERTSAGSRSWKFTLVTDDREEASGVWRGCPHRLKLCKVL